MGRKKLCEWSRGDLKEKPAKYARLVMPPRYVCGSCGRVAADTDRLCKPVRLPDPTSS